jgi:hypothetical protein
MILASHGIIGSSIVQFSAAALESQFNDRVVAAGGSLTSTERSALVTLIDDLNNAGIWTKMKAIYPMVGASAAACAQNLKSSSFTGTFTTGWTFASTGAKPNGTSAYMRTELIPFDVLNPLNFHLSYYSRTQAAGGLFDMGVGQLLGQYRSNLFIRRSNDTSGFDIGNNTGSLRTGASSQNDGRGFYIGTNRSLTDRVLLRNDVVIASSTTSYNNILMDSQIIIGAENTINFGIQGVNATSFSKQECALTSIGDGLTDTEASDFYDAVQAFETTLSRNV